MQTISNVVIGTLETVKSTIEERDQEVINRQKVFAALQQQDGQVNGDEAKQDEEVKEESLDKFKKVSFELLDIGLHYGSKGVNTIRSLPLYQRVDSVISLEDKFALVKKHGEELYTLLDSKLRPLVQNVFFLYDQATNTVTSYIKVITTKQDEITTYV